MKVLNSLGYIYLKNSVTTDRQKVSVEHKFTYLMIKYSRGVKYLKSFLIHESGKEADTDISNE
jgi:hypothetical protein